MGHGEYSARVIDSLKSEIQMAHSTQNAHDDKVRQLAHQMWEDDGRPEGRDEEFWFKAKQTLEVIPVMKPASIKAVAATLPVSKSSEKKSKSTKR
jgi:Protein of unknown function (DUF2934)